MINKMSLIPILTTRARTSGMYLGILNFLIARTIPFNRAHGFKIESLGENFIRTIGPYRKKTSIT